MFFLNWQKKNLNTKSWCTSHRLSIMRRIHPVIYMLPEFCEHEVSNFPPRQIYLSSSNSCFSVCFWNFGKSVWRHEHNEPHQPLLHSRTRWSLLQWVLPPIPANKFSWQYVSKWTVSFEGSRTISVGNVSQRYKLPLTLHPFVSTGEVCCEAVCMTVWILLILCMTIQNHVRVWDDLFYKENLEWIWCLCIVVMGMGVFVETEEGVEYRHQKVKGGNVKCTSVKRNKNISSRFHRQGLD